MQQVRGLTVALFITTFFGALWGMVGAFALPGAVSLLAGVLVGTVTVVLLLGSAWLLRLSQRLPVAVIVGLHYFGLIPAFRSRRFAAVGGAIVAVGLLSLVLPTGTGASPRGALVGLGCALVLWVSAFPPLVSALRRAGALPY